MSHPYAGPDPYDLDGVRTLCRGCHIESYVQNLLQKGFLLILESHPAMRRR